MKMKDIFELQNMIVVENFAGFFFLREKPYSPETETNMAWNKISSIKGNTFEIQYKL